MRYVCEMRLRACSKICGRRREVVDTAATAPRAQLPPLGLLQLRLASRRSVAARSGLIPAPAAVLCTLQALGRITPPPFHINLYAPRAPRAGARRAGRQIPTGQAASNGVEAMMLQSLNEFHVLPGRPSVAMA